MSATEVNRIIAAAAPPRTRRTVTFSAGGTEIVAEVWDPAADTEVRPVLLVHGGAAQRHWWDHIVTGIRHEGPLIALDLSGHGDSGRRERYDLDDWSDELGAAVTSLCASAPLLVGHSMGGLVSVNAAQRTPQLYAGVLALDSPLRRGGAGNIERRKKIAARPVRSFGSKAEALAGFKTAPPTPDADPRLMEHIAGTSIRRQGDRWALKFDPLVYDRPQVADDFVREASVPTWWLQAEHGFVDEQMASTIERSAGPNGRVIWGPGATHHMILEQPQAMTWLINSFLQVVGRDA